MTMQTLTTTACVGIPYGHVPGHQFADVAATYTRTRTGMFRVRLVYQSGSARGYDEVRIERVATGYADDLRGAVEQAVDRFDRVAECHDMHACAAGWAASAVSRAEADLIDLLDEEV